jgi:hypothetical protein
VPAAEGGVIGPAIIESSAPLPGIAAAAKGNGAAPADIGEGITFTFPSLTEATGALTALGLPAPSAPEVTIADPVALHQIISTMRRVGAGAKIDFQAGARRYGAEVVSGPGGNFLSNEVSFRALRLLGSAGSTKNPISFHTHTPRSDIIPDDDGTPAGKKARQTALDQATALRVRIIETSQRMIGAVGRLALDKRAAKKP